MQIRFKKTITVDGKKYRDGQIVAAGDIPAGCLESLKGCGHVEDYAAPQPVSETEPSEEQAETPKPRRSRK